MDNSRFEFRAWHKNLNYMIYKSLFDKTWKGADGFICGNAEYGEQSFLEIMQCLGVRDSDDNLIWEKDIVEGCGGIATIEWDDYQEAGARFCPLFYNDIDNYAHEIWSDKLRWHRFTVIGNIYQNTEMLK